MNVRGAARAGLSAVALLLALAVTAYGSTFSDDLAARRARLMNRVGPDALLVLWSAPVLTYSPDVQYEYRQDSNLYYLTGITQPGTMLVLMPGNESRRAILFIQEPNAAQEHWTGRRLSPEEATAQTGIDTVLTAGQFEPFVAAMLGQREFGGITAREAARFFTALAAGHGKLGLALDPNRGPNDPVPFALAFARGMRDRFVGFDIVDVTTALTDLRVVKTAYERSLLVRSFEISNAAQLAGMRATKPGAYEYEVKAAVEAVHRGRGAVSSYPSIVGSGPNATILHYTGSERQMQAGDLLLVDAACSLGYLSGDVTRTYPVNGTFSAAQRDIYQLVLQAQDEGARAAKPGASLQDVYARTVDVFKAGLLKLGLITDAGSDQYRLWYTHGSSHFIGVDVHDVGERTRPLEPGMAFTIEPGLYVRQSALDALPRTPENLAFIAQVLPAVRKYGDIGVRIEDSFLLEETGLRNLSGALPKAIVDVEAALRRKP